MAEPPGAVNIVDVAGVDPDVQAVVVPGREKEARGFRISDFGEKGVRSNLPERPGGCFAQIGPDPFFLFRPLPADAKREDQPGLAPGGPDVGPVREKGDSPHLPERPFGCCDKWGLSPFPARSAPPVRPGPPADRIHPVGRPRASTADRGGGRGPRNETEIAWEAAVGAWGPSCSERPPRRSVTRPTERRGG